MDPETHVIRIQRDDAWLNGYNPCLTLALRANHDVQYLHTQDHSLAIMYYILKYISKSEQSLYSKLAIAAAVRTHQVADSSTNTTGKTMLTQIYNKIQSHREVGTPEAISHLLEFPDHYTDNTFVPVSTTQLFHHFQQLTRLSTDHSEPLHIESGIASNVPRQDELDGEIIQEDNGYHFITFFDDYQYRGALLKDYCLYDYVSLYYKKKSNHGIPFEGQHPQHRTYTQICRTGALSIPNLLGCLTYLNPASTIATEQDKYFCILTALFIPWSKTTVPKLGQRTWEEHFSDHEAQISDRLARKITNISLLHKSKEESRFDRLQRNASSDIVERFLYEECPMADSELDEAEGLLTLQDSNGLSYS
jgi:hypothetical protein